MQEKKSTPLEVEKGKIIFYYCKNEKMCRAPGQTAAYEQHL